MGKNTYNDRAKRPPAFFEKLILVPGNRSMSHNVKHMLRTCSGLPSILATVCDIFFIIACPSDLLNFSVVAITHVGIVFVFSFSLLA